LWLIVELGPVAKITPCNRELAAAGLLFSPYRVVRNMDYTEI